MNAITQPTETHLIARFFQLLFDPGEGICCSPDVYGTEVCQTIEPSDLYFAINPLHTKRSDANVTSYRNILIEFDQGTKEEQYAALAGVPYSTLVWSGNKSLHAIISLEEPCEDKEEYDTLVRRIYNRLPGVDRAAKNPSRFSRMPEAIRTNGSVQSLLFTAQSRTTQDALYIWLGPDICPEVEEEIESVIYTGKALHRILKANTWYFLSEGAPKGEWNRQLFLACIDMCRAGFPNEEIMQRCADVTGKLTASDKRTISSAIKIVKAEK